MSAEYVMNICEQFRSIFTNAFEKEEIDQGQAGFRLCNDIYIFLDFDTSIMFFGCYKSEGNFDLLENVVCQFLSICLEVM